MTAATLAHGTPDYTALEFPAPPEDRPYVITNMVVSLDGSVVVEGTEQGLGSPVDQSLMRQLRLHADAVMNGAGTLRASGTSSRVSEESQALRRARGKAANPIAAVPSASGDLPLERAFFTARDFDALVYLAESAPPERRAAIEATGRPVVSLADATFIPDMLRHMRTALDARLLLVEGGPHLNGQLFDHGAVDECFFTLGALVVGGNAPLAPVVGGHPARLDALTRLELLAATQQTETGELYLRYRVTERHPRSP